MAIKYDYTRRARRFAIRHPMLNFVLVQINFWVVANMFLSVIIHYAVLSVKHSFNIPVPVDLQPFLLLSVILGVLYGLILGVTEYKLENTYFKRKSLGMIILTKSVLALGIFVFLFALMRFVLFDMIVVDFFDQQFAHMRQDTWASLFALFTVFYFFMILLINFINQVNRKYGPGVLIPLLLGKYRNPKEDERIFLFMDLKSSTSIAEELGHIRYSAFIRDAFMDINHVLAAYNAEIYQYVGDEIVITWAIEDGLNDITCINFFFACIEEFNKRREHYLNNYGTMPEFKAGLHMGKIMAVEIGEVKRDIAYHGDTVNTAARIQNLCNQYKKRMLVSDYLADNAIFSDKFHVETLGEVSLRGRHLPITIKSVELRHILV